MPEKLIDRARKAAEEIRNHNENCIALIKIDCGECACAACRPSIEEIAGIIERHMMPYANAEVSDALFDMIARDAELLSRTFKRNDILEQALHDTRQKLRETAEILRKACNAPRLSV